MKRIVDATCRVVEVLYGCHGCVAALACRAMTKRQSLSVHAAWPGTIPAMAGSADAGKRSAGLLLFRGEGDRLEVLLGHMGGPFWTGRQRAAWSIPKGEYTPDEPPLEAALREFREELGVAPPKGEYLDLGELRQRGGKRVHVWALAGEIDVSAVEPGTFALEWPKGSGNIQHFPELDRVAWCELNAAEDCLVAGQREFLHRLRQALSHPA